MPVHDVAKENLKEEVEKLEAAGERLRSIVPDGPGAYLITTEPPELDRRAAGGRETRPAK